MRVTGSGMGCPDWPKCFGLFSPPTCACQLPENYREIFLQKRIAKVQRFAIMLDKIGMTEKARQIREDKGIYEHEEFNVAKAWIEYINRIFGVIAGLLTLFFTILALRFKKYKGVLFYAILALIMLVLNAWLGSMVVATNLLPGLVSIHFMLSFLCIFFLMLSMHRLRPFESKGSDNANRKYWQLILAFLLLEVLMGTWARERVEYLQDTNNITQTNGWLNLVAMGSVFFFHRFLPGAIFLLAFWLYLKDRKAGNPGQKGFLALSVIVLVQICFGAFNIVLALPPWSQTIHIVIGSFLPVLAFYYSITKEPQITHTKL